MVGVAFVALVACTCAYTLYGASNARPTLGFGFFGFMIAGFLWSAVGIWAVCSVASHLVALSRGQPAIGSVRWWRWFVAPALVIATFLAVAWRVSVHARFTGSRAAFEDVARDALRHPRAERFTGSWPVKRVGWYDIRDVDFDGWVVHFTVAEVLGRSHGFAYSPSRLPRSPGSTYSEFDGDWYLWEHELAGYVD